MMDFRYAINLILLLWGAALTAQDTLTVTPPPADTPRVVADTSPWVPVDLMKELRNTARMQGKDIMLYFHYRNCPPCRNMEEGVFVSRTLMDYIEFHYVFVQLDAMENFDGIELSQKYAVKYYPTILLMDAREKNLKRLEGYQGVTELLSALQSYRKKKS